jgi:hypothetical protein
MQDTPIANSETTTIGPLTRRLRLRLEDLRALTARGDQAPYRMDTTAMGGGSTCCETLCCNDTNYQCNTFNTCYYSCGAQTCGTCNTCTCNC